MASVNLCTPLLNPHAETGINHFYDISFTSLKALHPNVNFVNTSSQWEISKVIDENTFMKIYDLATPINKARLDAIRRPHANAWLSAPPCQMLNLELPNLEFQTSLFRWLGAPIPQAATSLCAACQITLSPKAGHTTRCRHRGDIASRHNRIRDIVFSLASNAHLEPIKEKANILNNNPRRRPADVYIPQLFGGKAAALDIAVTCPLQDKYINLEIDPADHYADTVKHATYDEGFKGVDIDFIPVVMDTFGGYGAEGLRAITEIIRRGASRLNLPPSIYKTQCWQRLSLSLQKSNSRMVLTRVDHPEVF